VGVPLLPAFGRSLISIKTKGGINGIAKRWLKMTAFFFWFYRQKNFQEKTALKTAIPKIVFYRIYSTATNELQILVGMAIRT
jgi:hypothetical protein